ncbi:DUF4105 domain-containing protein [Flavobacterium amniphilum]|uniref:lipoprotein N-acyltransferase Lnb domain-containing protein n=1 Tax=Flavobacterium amniphilum TaxID=1834035 RepID=UPI002029BD14|nr:DUF4105 domain-containing protein [Flavobacterium amniphilum]MCL9805089.1 DUF4105 domain-containing protein [Flavobacterium amniphilum]
MEKTIIRILFLLLPFFAFPQFNPITQQTKISILTVDVANESHTLYGHTAIRVKDETNNFDYVWNYGMFDFRTENFILKFIKGDLQYYAAAYPYADFEYSYQEENRSIYEQVLNISFEEKQKLFGLLSKSVFSEDKFYTYKFIDRNCTTKAIDIINEALEKKPIQNTLHKDESYRSVLFPYQKDQFWMNFGINIIFGHRPDEEAKVLFLPTDLMKVLENTQYKGKSLAPKPETLYKASEIEIEFDFLNSIYPLLLILAVFVIANQKFTNTIYFGILGLIGLLFTLIGFYSLHREVLWNYNVLLFNPLNLFLMYFTIKNNVNWIKKTSLTCLPLLGIYLVYMLNKVHFWMVLPIIITSAIQLVRLYRQK